MPEAQAIIDEIERIKLTSGITTRSDLMVAQVFDAIVESLALVVADLYSGRIIYATRNLEVMFGYLVHGSLRGRNVDELVPLEVRDAHPGHRMAYAKNPTTRTLGSRVTPLYGLHCDGHTFPIAVGLSSAMVQSMPCVIAVVLGMNGRE